MPPLTRDKSDFMLSKLRKFASPFHLLAMNRRKTPIAPDDLNVPEADDAAASPPAALPPLFCFPLTPPVDAEAAPRIAKAWPIAGGSLVTVSALRSSRALRGFAR